jgi:validoxylamine A glucosyltransferase
VNAGAVNATAVNGAQQARISVVVPTYNRSALLARTLETLCGQRVPAGEFEVIVTDDGSGDDTPEVVRSFGGRLRLRYCFQEDQGFRVAAARNAGARLAAAPVLAFLDAGTLAGPDFVGGHIAAHARGKGDVAGPAGEHGGGEPGEHGGLAVVGYCFGYRPLVEMPWLAAALDELEPAQVVARYGDDPAFADVRHRAFAGVGFDLGLLTAPWFLFWTMNVSVTAAAFWEAGGFDENYRAWGGEDSELGYRLFRRGAAFAVSRDAWTIEVPSERKLAPYLQSVRRNARYFLKKHGNPVAEIAFGAFQTDDLDLVESATAVLASWTDEAADLEVLAELERAARDIPAGASIAIFGCGPAMPSCMPPCTLLDFDGRLLSRALADGRHTGHHAIGLRTPLPSRSVDIVIITSRLSGLWDRWGDSLLTEAHRIGHQVRGPFPRAEVPGRLSRS